MYSGMRAGIVIRNLKTVDVFHPDSLPVLRLVPTLRCDLERPSSGPTLGRKTKGESEPGEPPFKKCFGVNTPTLRLAAVRKPLAVRRHERREESHACGERQSSRAGRGDEAAGFSRAARRGHSQTVGQPRPIRPDLIPPGAPRAGATQGERGRSFGRPADICVCIPVTAALTRAPCGRKLLRLGPRRG